LPSMKKPISEENINTISKHRMFQKPKQIC
jgi:hypothetical protein